MDFFKKLLVLFKINGNIYLVTIVYEGISSDFLRNQIINENQIHFGSACAIQSLIFFKKKIIHRDIMMKNIIMDNVI